MRKGDIILLPFPFTDLSGSKVRPALILYNAKHDVTVAFISSINQVVDSTDISLTPDQSNGLKRDSVLKLHKIATLDKDIVLGKLGELTNKQLEDVDKGLKKIFNLK